MLKYVCLALFIALSSASLDYKDCGNGEIKSVEITGCTKSPCVLHKGKEVTFKITLAPSADSKSPKIELIAKLGELEVPVPNFNNDACKFMKCPVKKGETVVLSYTATIPAIAPTIEADVTAKLTDGSKTLACGTIHGAVKDF